ncbi:iron complex transport system permease protein [Corynebacterium appendicis CIP 107643]|uniref:Iron complex transport system permease protein n=1 Tax=Corynebacterium appendicis CIP 107643 TaxID=1161099 RepID=A0A1N7JXG7_9CORY|nr:iron ABC transporter permease [Corynebacterium appendicis]WJY60589.1 putative ABC transporter permease protein [Corynebacterium appendicis CIP 107643]SIS53981.1 iron complex transport system permease protein [Corynebacterium appendicis CIP 107643]
MRNPKILGAVAALVLVAAILLSLPLGSSGISLFHLDELSALQRSVLTDLRLPRVLMAACVGAILAVCGVAMQAITHNDLADPYLLGISSGASTGAVVAIIFSTFQWGIVAGASIGALLSFSLLMLLLKNTAADATRVVLTGVLVGYLFESVTSLVVTASGNAESTRGIMFWLLGMLSAARWNTLVAVVVVGAIGVTLLWLMSRYLDALSLGDETASTMGVPVVRVRYTVLIAVSLLTAATVASVGAIGFIGLIVPHAVRMLIGPLHRSLIPVSAIVGAIFLVVADAIARVLFAPQELPVGVITALIGVPLFFVILKRTKL